MRGVLLGVDTDAAHILCTALLLSLGMSAGLARTSDPRAHLLRMSLDAISGAVIARVLLRGAAGVAVRAARRRMSRPFESAAAAVGAAGGLLLALALTAGAFIRSHALRPAAIAAITLAGALYTFWLTRSLTRPLSRTSAWAALSIGILAATVHATVLRGLYPALHLALWGVGALSIELALTRTCLPRTLRVPPGLSIVTLLIAAVAFSLSAAGSAGHRPFIGLGAPRAFHAPSAVLAELAAVGAGDMTQQEPFSELAARAIPRGAQPERIVLLLVDTLRADVLEQATRSARDAERHVTPHLFELARESRRFSRAYAHASITHRSVSAMLHGLVRPGDVPRPEQHLARVLRESDRKVHTAFVGWSWFATGDEIVRDTNARSLAGFDETHYYDFAEQVRVVDLVRDVLARANSEERLLLIVHLACMHDPGYDGAPISSLVAHAERYRRSLAWLDRTVGALLRIVEADSAPTALLLTADHGEGLGDHELDFHGTHTFEEEIHVPLWLRAPGVPAAEQTELTVHAELAPTVTDLFGLPPHPAWRGRSLLSRTEAPPFAHAENTSGREVALTDGRDKLVLRGTEQTLVYYDLVRDPKERTPLPPRATPESRALLRELVATRPDLFEKLRREPDFTATLKRARSAADAGSHPRLLAFFAALEGVAGAP